MEKNEFTSVIKRIIPLVGEIRHEIGAENGIVLEISPDGGFKAELFEHLSHGELYSALQANYIPPQRERIEIDENIMA